MRERERAQVDMGGPYKNGHKGNRFEGGRGNDKICGEMHSLWQQ